MVNIWTVAHKWSGQVGTVPACCTMELTDRNPGRQRHLAMKIVDDHPRDQPRESP